MQQLLEQRGAQLTVDLPNQVVIGPDGTSHRFEIAPLSKKRLMRGLDEISHTRDYGDAIARFEQGYAAAFSWLA
jgi:3-isopropylmalate dehydratase small subunit